MDASKITKPGEFIYQINGKNEILQSPLLELDKAKELLMPFKIELRNNDDNSNVVDMEREATATDIKEEIQFGLLEGGNE